VLDDLACTRRPAVSFWSLYLCVFFVVLIEVDVIVNVSNFPIVYAIGCVSLVNYYKFAIYTL
jgi:hypothetical protein